MKILQIIPTLDTGGGEMFCTNISNSLAETYNYEVTICVLASIKDDSILKKRISKKVKVISLNKNKGLSLLCFYKLYKLIKDIKPDIIHTHLRSSIYILLTVILLKKNIYIHTIHTVIEKEAKSIFRKLLYKFYFNNSLITPVSITETISQDVKKIFKLKKNVVIENGVPTSLISKKFLSTEKEINNLKFNKDTKVLLSIGRINPIKNQSFLIKIMKDLENENKNIILVLIGSLINDENYTKECFNLLNNLSNTFILGEKENVSDYIYLSDLICMSSLYEGHPLVLLESLSMGKEIISTKVGGIPDILGNNIGTLLELDDKNNYKLEIINLLDKSNDRTDLLKKEFDSKYHIDICTQKYIKIYKEHIKLKDKN